MLGAQAPADADVPLTRDVVLVNPLGLHARPAAQVAALASGVSAELTVSLPGRTPVAARSPLGLAGLGTRGGDTVTLRAAGPEDVVGTMPEDYLPGLKAILADSLKRSPEMIARSFEHVIQEARFTMAKSARLPNLGGNFDYGITQTATVPVERLTDTSGEFTNSEGVNNAN